MKKVIIFLPGGIGGAERVGIIIGRRLAQGSFDVSYVIAQKEGAELINFLPKDSRYTIIPDHSLWDFSIFRMARIIRSQRPDVVFAPCRYLSRNLIVASKLSGIRCKVIARSDNPLRTLNKKGQWLIRKTFPYADIVIAQQEEMAEEIVKDYPVPSHKVITLHNPIDEDVICDKIKESSPFINSEETRFVWVARISESGSKGQDVLIEAMSTVIKYIKNAHLYLVGPYQKNGLYYNKLRELIRDKGLEPFVHFIGYDDNPYRWVANADCFVLPSRVEGLPNALIEAMYIGKPVVSTTCLPIIERMVRDGYNGYKVPVEDPDALADAMCKAINLKGFSMIYHPASTQDIMKVFSL